MLDRKSSKHPATPHVNGLSPGCRTGQESWQEYGGEAPVGKCATVTRQGQETGKCHGCHKHLGPQTCVQICRETQDTAEAPTNKANFRTVVLSYKAQPLKWTSTTIYETYDQKTNP